MKIAVIGLGPRGLGALEALAQGLNGAGARIDLDIFDPIADLGAGPNFSPDENALCALNIPAREISIEPRGERHPRDPGFEDCLHDGSGPETFPPRAELGRYLRTRFRLLERKAHDWRINHHRSTVRRVARDENGWFVETEGERFGPYREVLLATGQTRTEPDEQLSRWQQHASERSLDLLPAYPAARLLDAAQAWAGAIVAIRGLGLSTLDVVRLLTLGQGGRFESGRYCRSGREPGRILPFSLDGHPPVPKPANAALDRQFDPMRDETSAFEKAVSEALAVSPDACLERICRALVAPAERVLGITGGSGDVEGWLEVERAAPGTQEERAPLDALRNGIEMADGRAPPSPGFVIGQLWRKWQSPLRRAFNPADTDEETAKALIGFDEGLKRYSYGPPVSTARELALLIDAGVVSLYAADDPDVLPVENGWRLVEDDVSVTATAMVDAVLPSPQLQTSTEPLITDLVRQGWIVPVSEGLGARTTADGQLVGSDGGVQTGLCMLGRGALGSVIAVDSIHDCFGASSERWADGVMSRMGVALNQVDGQLSEEGLG